MRRVFVLILIISCFSRTSIGMDERSLYSATVSVLSQSIDERTEAAKEGLKLVLIKLTGTSNVIDEHPAISQELQRAAYYLQDFDYQLASISASQHRLNLYFNSRDIDYLLAKEHIAIWHGKRPSLLVWLSIQDENHSNQLISYDSVDTVLPVLSVYADERRLPLVLPFIDTKELSYLTDVDIETMSVAPFIELSKRYLYDAIIIGRLVKTDKAWQSKWILVDQKFMREWEQTGNDAALLVASMLNNVGQYFFKALQSQQVSGGSSA